MERRLLPINAWIALHRGEAGWPARFADQGFDIHRLEVPVTVKSGGVVVVDGISIRRSPAAVVSTEAKSGASIENRQAQRYAEITPMEVARHAGLPFPPSSAAHEVLYACTREGRSGVRVDLDRLGLQFPLLVVGDSRVSLETMGSAVLAPFDDNVPGPPPRYIVLDEGSSDEEFAEQLLPELIAAASRGEKFVSVEILLRSVLPYWDVFGANAKRALVRRARDVLVRLIDAQFKGDFEFESRGSAAGGDVIKIVNNPISYDPRGQTQSWQRLQRRAARALGRPRRTESPGQTVMFEDLGLTIDQP